MQRPIAVLALLALAAFAASVTINFDTVSTTTSVASIPNGYAGYDWSDALVDYGPTRAGRGVSDSGQGYQSGVRSGSYAAFNGFATLASLSTPGLAASMAGFSGYFTAAFPSSGNGSTSVTVQGLRNGVVVGTTTVSIVSTGPTLVSGTFLGGADTLTFVGNNTVSGEGQVVLDDLTITPTPEPSALAALGLGSLALLRRRKWA